MGLRINIKKTEVVVSPKSIDPPQCNIILDGTPIKQSNSIVYLGSMITHDARCNKEIGKESL